MLEPRNFNICINITVPIIAMLDCLEVDMEVSDTGMETAESNDYREISENNRDTKDMLAMM